MKNFKSNHVLISLFLSFVFVAGCNASEPEAEDALKKPETSQTQSGGSESANQSANKSTAKTADKNVKKGDNMSANPIVKMETSKGTITIELDAEKAPETVKNFVSYVEDGFYDGLIFHRVIPNFMIQGGGMTPDMSEKPNNAPIKNEASNGLKNDRGTIAMARTQDPHSATSQFFINLKDNDFLNFSSETPAGWGYTVFGKVTEGMDVVDEIAVTGELLHPLVATVHNDDLVTWRARHSPRGQAVV